jgi:hypothetical protein
MPARLSHSYSDLTIYRVVSVIDISTTIRIKCSQLNIFLLRIAGSSTTKPVRASSKKGRPTNADTHHHLNIGFRPRWRVLRPYPLGSGRRGRHRAGDNIVDSPHRLHARLVPLIVRQPEESNSRLPPPFALILTGYRYGERICDVTDMRESWL